MNEELQKKLAAIPQEDPDEVDLLMIEAAARTNDRSLVALDALKEALSSYSGKMLLRMPKSLHRRLTEEAQLEGVSINQYVLYKLSQ